MIDLKLTQDEGRLDFDISISPQGDFETVNDLSTAILLSLLTDRRAEDNQVVVPQYRRGWIGDIEPPSPGYQIGSHLWLVEPGKATQQTVSLAADAARDALQWLVDQGIAVSIDVTGQLTGPQTATLRVDATAPDGSQSSEFLELWENTSFLPSVLPDPFVEPPPFSPSSIPDLVVWGDADFSQHNVDSDCGVSLTADLANNADYFQTNAARRPLRIRGSGGWLYRFDGVDDFMITNNQPFTGLRQGAAFFVYKPTSGQNNGRRFFALGANGFEASERGLAFLQDAADTVRLLGSSGTLDVSVAGPSAGDAPVGVVFRWGPAENGGDVETSDGQAATDGSYSADVSTVNQAVLGAGFDGAGADVTEAAGFEVNLFAFYGRRLSDTEVLSLLDYSETRIFTSPVGEQFSDCFMFSDDFGWTD